jgi:adenosine deaminase
MNPVPDLRRFVRGLPKAELHVHLEGSMRPRLLLALARRHGLRLPADDEAGLSRWFRFEDFEHFVEIYLTCSSCLRDPEDFQALLDDFATVQLEQNVVYSEVHFTISTHLANGANGDELAHALGESIAAAESRGTTIRLIPDIVRNLGPERADRTLEWALAHRERGVVALGLAGIESSPVEPFGRHYAAARSAGLRTTAHAGEQCGPDAIREVLEVCEPERVGHGIRAIDDPGLVAELAAARIPLEVCPTSNVRLGYAESVEEHPFERLRQAGLAVSLSSDDPPLFGTSLVDEFGAVGEAFGYSLAVLARLARSAFEHSFLTARERASFLARFDDELASASEAAL